MSSLLKQIIKEMDGAVSATSVAGVPTSLGDSPKKRKANRRAEARRNYNKKGKQVLKKKHSMLSRLVKEGDEASTPAFDEQDVISKLKNAESTFDTTEDTVGFVLEDDEGNVVKVFVRAEQAEEFEGALANALDEVSSSEQEIAEVLFNLRNDYDIVDIVWPEVPEDEETVDNELEGAEGEMGDEEAAAGEEELGDEEGDMTADEDTGGEEAATSALQSVIDMMSKDAEAKKAEAEAKTAAANAETAKYAAQAAEEKVKSEEEVMDMEAYYDKKSAEDKEAKKLAKMAKYKHDLASDSEADTFESKSSFLDQVINEMADEIECKYCDFKCSSEDKMKEHMKAEHKDEKQLDYMRTARARN